MKIAIITDGNNKLGMGHIYQSICIAGMLLQRNIPLEDIIFMTQSQENVQNHIMESGFLVNYYPDNDSIFNDLKKINPDRIIFDKLDVSPDLAKRIKYELHIKLTILTNLTDANLYADITVLADIGSNFKNIYRKEERTNNVHFLGPKYWLLRPEFYELKSTPKISSLFTKNIMLIFGGSDVSNLTSVVLDVLLKIESEFTITVVLGSAFIHDKELNEVIHNNCNTKSHVQIVKNIKNVAEIMFKSHVVLASPGLSFFEALAVGTPVIGFHQNDLQRDTYKGFLTTVDICELNNLPEMIEYQTYIYPDNPFIKSMEIGEGKEEILDEILK